METCYACSCKSRLKTCFMNTKIHSSLTFVILQSYALYQCPIIGAKGSGVGTTCSLQALFEHIASECAHTKATYFISGSSRDIQVSTAFIYCATASLCARTYNVSRFSLCFSVHSACVIYCTSDKLIKDTNINVFPRC